MKATSFFVGGPVSNNGFLPLPSSISPGYNVVVCEKCLVECWGLSVFFSFFYTIPSHVALGKFCPKTNRKIDGGEVRICLKTIIDFCLALLPNLLGSVLAFS